MNELLRCKTQRIASNNNDRRLVVLVSAHITLWLKCHRDGCIWQHKGCWRRKGKNVDVAFLCARVTTAVMNRREVEGLSQINKSFII